MSSKRERLPDRRKSLTHTMRVDGTTVHFTIGFYPDGRVGELFVDMHKFGSSLRDWVGLTAMEFSVLLQHGVTLNDACDLFIGRRMDPHGAVSGLSCAERCESVMDAIGKELLCVYANSARNLTTLAAYARSTTARAAVGQEPTDNGQLATSNVSNSG